MVGHIDKNIDNSRSDRSEPVTGSSTRAVVYPPNMRRRMLSAATEGVGQIQMMNRQAVAGDAILHMFQLAPANQENVVAFILRRQATRCYV